MRCLSPIIIWLHSCPPLPLSLPAITSRTLRPNDSSWQSKNVFLHNSRLSSRDKLLKSIPRGGAAFPQLSPGVLLGITITLEVLATSCMKLAVSNKIFYVGVAMGYGLCFTLFPMVLRQMSLAVAYAIWSGAGTALTTLVSTLFFGETLTVKKVACILLIISGVIGLNLSGGGH